MRSTEGQAMSGLSDVVDTPEKLLIAAGTASVLVSIIVPATLPYIGVISWTPWKRYSLGVIGCVLLIGGVSLEFLPTSLFFKTSASLTPTQISDINNTAPTLKACEVLQSSGDQPASVNFINSTQGTVSLYWIDDQCNLVHYYDLNVSSQLQQQTYIGHRWLVTDADRRPIAIYDVVDKQQAAVIKN